MTATGQIGLENSVYYGYTVTVVTATAAINIRKTSTTGQIIDVIPSGTAAGVSKLYGEPGVAADGGLFIDFNGGTGTVVVLYE